MVFKAYHLTWNLACDRAAHLGLGVFEKLHESGHQVSVDNLLVYRFRNLRPVSLEHVSLRGRTYLLKPVCDHVSDSPALVFEQTP
jgi:hypothetical protein